MSGEVPAGGRRLINATAVMASGTMVSRVLGLVRSMLIVFILGNAGWRADTFGLAMTVPSSLYLLLAGGTLNNVLVPQIVRAVNHDPDGGKAFVDRIMTGFLVLLGALTIVFTVATPLVMSIYTKQVWRTPEVAEYWRSLLLMSYIAMPQIFFYGLFFLIGQVLNARERFGPMMWAPILNNVVSIGTLGVYLWVWGAQSDPAQGFTDSQVWLLGIGSTVGIAVQTLVLLPYLKRAGFSYRPRFDLKGTGLGRTFHVAKWMVGYVALTSLAQVVVTNLASGAAPASQVAAATGGGVQVYGNAYLIWILPHSLLTVSLATAMLPTASTFAAAGDLTGVSAETRRALRLSLTFLVPASAAFVALGDPLTRALFGNGAGAADYHLVAWALMAFGIGLVPFTIQYLYLRAFFALDNTKVPFLLQIWISGANAALAVGLVMAWDSPGTVAARLALSYSLAYTLGVFLTHRALKRRLPGLDGTGTWRFVLRLLWATLPAAALAWVITWWFARYPSALLRIAGLALAGLLAVLTFFFAAKRLRIPEATTLLSVLRRPKPSAGDSDAVEAILDETNEEDDHPAVPGSRAGAESGPGVASVRDAHSGADAEDPDPDGTGVFVPVAAAAPPAEVLDFPSPPVRAAGPGGALPDDPVLGARYRLEERLSVRGANETWRGQDEVLGRPVLVHLLAPRDPHTAQVLRLARDAALATDSRFLRVLDVVDTEVGTDPYLVYEYSAGQTLEKVLQAGPLTGVETAWILREVADALIGLHAQGHYHRHLSPATLLITASGNVKMLGFGVNEAAQPSDDRLDGQSSDVQALGKVLYASLTGRWPDGERFGLRAAPSVDGRPVLPSQVRGGVTPAVEQVVDRILSPLPRGNATRLVTAQEVTTALSLVLGPISAASELQSRLHPTIDPDGAPPAPRSKVAPPVPTPAASRFQVVARPADLDDGADEADVIDEATAPFVAEALSRGDSFTPVPPPADRGTAEAAPVASRTPRARWVLGGLVLVLALGLVAALGMWLQPSESPFAAAPEVLKVRAVTDFDPKADGGSGVENSTQAGLAIDGDAKTLWRTERYRKLAALGGLKPGVGLVLDLGANREVTTVAVQLAGKGTALDVGVPGSSGETARMKSIDRWERIVSADDASGTLTLDLPASTRTRYLLVYLTSLPDVGDGYYRGGIAEITVRGR